MDKHPNLANPRDAVDSVNESVLITGADGYIGSYLTDRLSKNGYNVIPINRNICDIRSIDTLAGQDPYSKVTTVCHLAALTGVESSWSNPSDYYSINVLGTQKVLEFCRMAHAKMVFVSGYVYGDSSRAPIPESTTPAPKNPYSHSKWLAEELCSFYAEQYGISCNIIRPFNVYGGQQSTDFLIPHIISQTISKEKYIWVNDIRPSRDYIYIVDLADAVLSLMLAQKSRIITNVGTGFTHTVGEVIDLIQGIWGTNKEVRTRNKERPNEISVSIADISYIKNLTGWSPRYNLESGLSEMFSNRLGNTSPISST